LLWNISTVGYCRIWSCWWFSYQNGSVWRVWILSCYWWYSESGWFTFVGKTTSWICSHQICHCRNKGYFHTCNVYNCLNFSFKVHTKKVNMVSTNLLKILMFFTKIILPANIVIWYLSAVVGINMYIAIADLYLQSLMYCYCITLLWILR